MPSPVSCTTSAPGPCPQGLTKRAFSLRSGESSKDIKSGPCGVLAGGLGHKDKPMGSAALGSPFWAVTARNWLWLSFAWGSVTQGPGTPALGTPGIPASAGVAESGGRPSAFSQRLHSTASALRGPWHFRRSPSAPSHHISPRGPGSHGNKQHATCFHTLPPPRAGRLALQNVRPTSRACTDLSPHSPPRVGLGPSCSSVHPRLR